MKKFFFLFIFICFSILNSYADIINELKVTNNKRISEATIITYGQIELGKNYNQDELNKIIKNLYETNFFKDISLNIDNNILFINVVENKIIQSVVIEGVKSQRIQKAILKNLFSKDKAPFLI